MWTDGQQKEKKKCQTSLKKTKQTMPDRDTVRASRRAKGHRGEKKKNSEKSTECFNEKALYSGYNYLQNTLGIY